MNKKTIGAITVLAAIIIWFCISSLIGSLLVFVGMKTIASGYNVKSKLVNIGSTIVMFGFLGAVTQESIVVNIVIASVLGILGIILFVYGIRNPDNIEKNNEDDFQIKPDMKKFICDKCGNISIGWNDTCSNCGEKNCVRKGTKDEIILWNKTECEKEKNNKVKVKVHNEMGKQ